MGKQSFKTTIIGGESKSVTGIEVPPEIVAALAGGQRPRLKISANGYQFVSSLGKMGGKFMLSLSAEHRKASGLDAGDEVTVELEVASDPPAIDVPDDLLAPMVANGSAQRFADASPSRRKEWVRQIGEAKTAETRARRIQKVLASLAAIS